MGNRLLVKVTQAAWKSGRATRPALSHDFECGRLSTLLAHHAEYARADGGMRTISFRSSNDNDTVSES